MYLPGFVTDHLNMWIDVGRTGWLAYNELFPGFYPRCLIARCNLGQTLKTKAAPSGEGALGDLIGPNAERAGPAELSSISGTGSLT